MKEPEFKNLDPLADALDERCDQWFSSEHLAGFKEAMQRISASLPPRFHLCLAVELRVFDEEREKEINLLTRGVNTSEGREPYDGSGDSSVHRYIVDGEICQLPHNYCPHCWGNWDFKLLHPTCPDCGYAMGKEVKLLLDTDVCPNCEEGSVSMANLTCDRCRHEVDSSFVTWG